MHTQQPELASFPRASKHSHSLGGLSCIGRGRGSGGQARTHILPLNASILGPDSGFSDGGQVGACDC